MSDSIVLDLAWNRIRIDQILWIRIRIRSMRIHITSYRDRVTKVRSFVISLKSDTNPSYSNPILMISKIMHNNHLS